MKKLYLTVILLLISSATISAQMISEWQSLGSAGGSAADDQYQNKGMLGYFAAGLSDDTRNVHWGGVRFNKFMQSLDADDERLIPYEYALEQNYPNPFNPSTTIEYSLREKSEVSIAVYNILGQKVVELVNETQPAGSHSAIWDGRNSSGAESATGLYFYRISAGEFIKVKKMMLIK